MEITLNSGDILTLAFVSVLVLVAVWIGGYIQGQESMREDWQDPEPLSEEEKNRRALALMHKAGAVPERDGLGWYTPESAVKAARHQAMPDDWLREIKPKPMPDFLSNPRKDRGAEHS